MNIHQKLNRARLEFHQQPLKKTGWNAFSKYAYFELSDFLVPALRIFNDVGLCAVVSFAQDLAIMTIYEVDGPGALVITSPMAEAPLKGTHPIQQMGAVETYSRRYLWVAALEIVEHDAVDSTPARDPNEIVEEFERKISKMTADQVTAMKKELKSFCAEQNQQVITNRLSQAYKARIQALKPTPEPEGK